MKVELPEGSVLRQMQKIPDPRRREGQIYPHWSIFGMLIFGAINGEGSLRGMWMRGVKDWALISRPLGFVGNARPPSYGTVWYLVSRVDTAAMDKAAGKWGMQKAEDEAISIDGKFLRGSKRTEPAKPALEVITAVAQKIKIILGQQTVGAGGETTAVLAVLQGIPLDGKIVTADAGLLDRAFVDSVLEGGGDYLGLLKENQAEVKQALDTWMEADLFPLRKGTPRR